MHNHAALMSGTQDEDSTNDVRLELEGKENKDTHHNSGVACSTVPPTLTEQ